MTPSVRSRAVLTGLACVGIAVLWGKVRLYGSLEYQLDVFSFLQMSRALLDGRLPLFENGWGRDAALHNYFTVPLLLPVSSLFGAPGLFGILVAAFLAAPAALVLLGRRFPPERRRALELVGAAFFFSPAALWMVDDAPYGFHVELLIGPLAVVFAAGLLLRARWAWGVGALLAMTREEGPLAALAVHATVAWAREWEAARSSRRAFGAALRAAAPWTGAFAVGLALLAVQRIGEPAQSRAAGAVTALLRLPSRPDILSALGRSAAVGVLLLASGAVVAVAGISLRPVVVAAAAALPLAGAAVVGGLASNYGAPGAVFFHGLSWAPRLAALWGILAAALAASVATSPTPFAGREREAARLGVAALALSLVLQTVILSEWRSWNAVTRWSPARLRSGAGTLRARLSAREDAALRELARLLPPRTPLAATPALGAAFDRHDLVWPDRALEAWVPPVVVVCDTEGRTFDDRGCVALLARRQGEGWPGTSADGVAAASVPALSGIVEEAMRGLERPDALARSAASGGTAETRSGNPNR